MYRAFLLMVALGVGISLRAQQRQADSLQHLKRNLLYEFSAADIFALQPLDSNGGKLHDSSFHMYHRYSPLVEKSIGWQDQGLTGTPVLRLDQVRQPASGFVLCDDHQDIWWTGNGERKYYQTPLAVTDLNYAQGPPNMLYLEALHTQNIRAGWNAGVHYRHTAWNNLYFDNLPNRDRTRMASLFSTRLFSSYISADSHYVALADVMLDRNTLQESGGITDPLRFEQLTGRAREFNNFAQLSNAGNRFNRNAIHFKQGLRRKLFIQHQLDLGRDMNRFEYGNTDTFLPPSLFSSTTFDSLRHFYAKNRLEITKSNKDHRWLLGLLHAHHDISQPQNTNARYQNTAYRLGWDMRRGSHWQTALKWEQYLTGYNSGDAELAAQGRYSGEQGVLALATSWQQREPDFLSRYFVSNHYLWFNESWNKEQHLQLQLSWQSKGEKWRSSIALRNTAGMVYYGSNALPQQSTSNWQYVSWTNRLKIKRGAFRSEPELLLQAQNIALIGLPGILAKVPLSFTFSLFKGNLKAESGLDVWVHSPFIMNYYNPVSRRYQLGQGTASDWQLRANAFLNMQIRTVRAFVMYERLNDFSGQALYSSYLMPDLPGQLRFGIGWMLYN